MRFILMIGFLVCVLLSGCEFLTPDTSSALSQNQQIQQLQKQTQQLEQQTDILNRLADSVEQLTTEQTRVTTPDLIAPAQ